ncbi:MAG: hypothetical protein ACMG57_02560 [Candidatus Dojkabacteria bacterium]
MRNTNIVINISSLEAGRVKCFLPIRSELKRKDETIITKIERIERFANFANSKLITNPPNPADTKVNIAAT